MTKTSWQEKQEIRKALVADGSLTDYEWQVADLHIVNHWSLETVWQAIRRVRRG